MYPMNQQQEPSRWCNDVLRNVLRLPRDMRYEIKQHLMRLLADTILDYSKITAPLAPGPQYGPTITVRSPSITLDAVIKRYKDAGTELSPIATIKNRLNTSIHTTTQQHSFFITAHNGFITLIFTPPSPNQPNATLITMRYSSEKHVCFPTLLSLLAAYLCATLGDSALKDSVLEEGFDSLDPMIKNAIKKPTQSPSGKNTLNAIDFEKIKARALSRLMLVLHRQC